MIKKVPSDIQNMFNTIASRYDFWNNIISFFTHGFVKKYAIKNLKIKPNTKLLDLCCGTGDLAIIAKNIEPSLEVYGADFSFEMINIAKKKTPDVIFSIQNAVNLSFENSYFDYVVSGFGLRNIEDRKAAIDEVFRVLKNGGSFLHMDFGDNNFLSCIYNFIVLF